MNKKIIVSALAIAMGATLAGSISGTVAWYQYSTRAQAAYIGTSVGLSENLEVKTSASTWKRELTSTEIDTAKGSTGTVMNPVTTGALAKNEDVPAATNFYANPEYGMSGYSTWTKATAANVVQFTLNFHYKKTDASGGAATYVAKKLNLINLTIVDESGADLYKAVRVHFASGTKYNLFARDSQTDVASPSDITTDTYGNLDTGNNGVYDQTEGYEWDTRSTVVYGDDDTHQVANNAGKTDLAFYLADIPASEAGVAVTVTIWLEGWTKLSSIPSGNADTGTSAIWSPQTYINKAFKVGMRFGVSDAA